MERSRRGRAARGGRRRLTGVAGCFWSSACSAVLFFYLGGRHVHLHAYTRNKVFGHTHTTHRRHQTAAAEQKEVSLGGSFSCLCAEHRNTEPESSLGSAAQQQQSAKAHLPGARGRGRRRPFLTPHERNTRYAPPPRRAGAGTPQTADRSSPASLTRHNQAQASAPRRAISISCIINTVSVHGPSHAISISCTRL